MVISVKIVSKSLLKFFLRLINRFIKTPFTNGLCHSVNWGCQSVCKKRVPERLFFSVGYYYYIYSCVIIFYLVIFLYNQSFGRGCKFYWDTVFWKVLQQHEIDVRMLWLDPLYMAQIQELRILNLDEPYYNGSAAKSHSTTTQYRQLRRLSHSCSKMHL